MGVLIGIVAGTALTALAANVYSIFQPGGDLQGTWNSQTLTAGAVDLAGAEVTGVLPAANGGSSFSTYTQGDLLYASAANTLSKLAKNASSTRVLTNTGTTNNPAWAQVTLTNGVTGILPVANGGTNNAFIAWSGPATSAKTYTLPNATSTILTSNAAVTLAQGGTGLTSAADDTTLVSSGAAWVAKTLPACTDTGGNHLNYDQSTNTFSCGVSGSFSGTTGSIGGGALLAGACTSGTVSITGATTSMVAVASPNTYPGDGSLWNAQVTSSNTVTVRVCADVALTPTASTYNVRVIQ